MNKFSYPSSISNEVPRLLENTVKEVAAGSRAVLDCNSNDSHHNFLFWILGKDQIIGPGAPVDDVKYKYEVLSGKLHIANVSPDESGIYRCVSKSLNGGFTIGGVDMVVDTFSYMDVIKLLAIIISIVVLASCAVIYYQLRKEWSKYDGRAIVPVDEEDEEVEGDEIYNATTTNLSQPMPGPSRPPSRNQSSEHLLYGIDNQGLDTDFNSVFENIQIKSPPSLI